MPLPQEKQPPTDKDFLGKPFKIIPAGISISHIRKKEGSRSVQTRIAAFYVLFLCPSLAFPEIVFTNLPLHGKPEQRFAAWAVCHPDPLYSS